MVPHHEFWVGLPALCMVPHPSAFSFSTHTRILYRDEPIGQRVILRVDHFGHLFQRNETRSQRLIAVSVLLWPSWPLSGHLGPSLPILALSWSISVHPDPLLTTLALLQVRGAVVQG